MTAIIAVFTDDTEVSVSRCRVGYFTTHSVVVAGTKSCAYGCLGQGLRHTTSISTASVTCSVGRFATLVWASSRAPLSTRTWRRSTFPYIEARCAGVQFSYNPRGDMRCPRWRAHVRLACLVIAFEKRFCDNLCARILTCTNAS